jgi:hypothetical protein
MHPSKVPKKKTNKTKTALEEQSKTPTKITSTYREESTPQPSNT